MKKATAFGADEKKPIPVFGIDLGTTNSAISVISQGNEAKTITLVSGKKTMPSCILWKDGEFVVGDEAYQNRWKENAVYSVKRLMQRPNGYVKVKDNGTEATFTPAEISAEILKGLVKQTGGVYGEIKDVVVTVPAYFDQNGINATKQACELAGLNLIAIANEPTAASLNYHLNPEDGEVKDVVVYDLGGGTFDASLLRITDSDDTESELAAIYGGDIANSNSKHSVIALSIRGDMRLGGDDIDDELLRIVLEKLAASGVPTKKIPAQYLEQMKLRLERYKKDSVNAQYELNVNVTGINGRPITGKCTLHPEDFLAASMVIFKRTQKILDELLASAPNNVDTIVLTGGSTKNPWIQQALQTTYPNFRIDNALSPDLSVSQGAAIQGKITKFGDETIQIFDVLPLTIGALVENGKVEPIIPGASPLPVTRTMSFTTQYDNQEAVSVKLMQGNSVEAYNCISLGKLTIDGITPKKAGEADLKVTISINANRFMKCVAKIDGIERELQVDLSGETEVVDVSEMEKTLIRLSRAGALMSAENKERLDTMISVVRDTGDMSRVQEIKQFIRDNRNEAIS